MFDVALEGEFLVKDDPEASCMWDIFKDTGRENKDRPVAPQGGAAREKHTLTLRGAESEPPKNAPLVDNLECFL